MKSTHTSLPRAIAILLFLLSLIPSKGQDFAPVGAEWYYQEVFVFAPDTNYIKFRSEKDTLIFGETCRKITKRHKIFCNDRPDVEYLFSRNDTVFFLDTIFNRFQILYDFNAVQHSSWIIETRDERLEIDTLTITVDSLDTIQINGKSLKVMHVTYVKDDENQPNTYPSTIIEKLGDIRYMFNWEPFSFSYCDANLSRGIRCYQDGNFGLYSSGLADSCNHISKGLDLEQAEVSKTFDLFPNPAEDILELGFEQGLQYRIELLNLNGQLIKTQEGQDTSIKLDLGDFDKGLYILRVYKGHHLLGQEKLMKE